MASTQLYVTGLFNEVTSEDLKPILSPYGTVKNIKIRTKNKEGDEPRTFAIVDIEADEKKLVKCFTAYNNTLWKGKKIKISRTKENLIKDTKKKTKAQELLGSDTCVTNGFHNNHSSEEQTHMYSANELPISSKRKNLFSEYKNHRYRRSENEKSCDDDQHEEGNSKESNICEGVSMFKGISSIQQSVEMTPSFEIKSEKRSKPECALVNDESNKNFFSTSTPKSPSKNSSVVNERNIKKDPNSIVIDLHSKSRMDWKSPALSRLEGFSSIWRDDAKCENAVVSFEDERVQKNLDEVYNSDSSEQPVTKICKEKKHKVVIEPCSAVVKRNKASDFFENDENSSQSQKTKKVRKRNAVLSQFVTEEMGEKIIPTDVAQLQKTSPQNTVTKMIKCKTVEQKLEDNEKRIRSVKEKQSSLKAKQKAVQNALSSVDSKEKMNKKIIFLDDEDKNEDVVDKKEHSKKKNLSKTLDKQHLEMDTNRMSLFEEDADDEFPTEHMDEVFRDKKQFHGSYGEELLELQSKFATDERFRIDERFFDEKKNNDVEVLSEDVVDDNQISTEDFNNEKLRSLGILKNIVKDSSTALENEKKIKKWKVTKMVRYDASNPEHKVYEQKVKKKSIEKKDLTKDNGPVEDVKNIPPVVSEERFYQVDPSLESALIKDAKTTEKESFSLLNMFSNMRNENIDNFTSETLEKEKYMTTSVSKQVKNPLLGHIKDETDLQDDMENPKIYRQNKAPEVHLKRKETFFIFADDARLTEGTMFFHRKEEWHVDYNKWIDIRQALKRNIKTQGKRSLLGRHRKRFNQNKNWK